MKAVCAGDRWLGPDRQTVHYVADVLPSGAVLMRPERLRKGGVYVPRKALEHQDGWTYLPPRKDGGR